MSPPELPRDAPVPEVLHPVQVHLLPARGIELHLPFARDFDRRRGQGRHLHEPLQRQIWFDHRAAAAAVPHRETVRLFFLQVAGVAQRLDDPRAGLEPLESAEIAGVLVHHAALVHHDARLQPMTTGQREVVRVVRGRDLDRTRAELGIDRGVRHDGDLPPQQRQHRQLSDQRLVAAVAGMHRHAHVSEHGLGTRGGHRHLLGLALPLGRGDERITDEPQRALGLHVIHFLVGESGLAARAPVHDPVSAIHQPLVVELLEHQQHRARIRLVQGEALAAPIGGDAEAPELVEDQAAILRFPSPHFLDEGLAPQLLSRDPPLAQRLLHRVLRGDAGVVGAGQPERLAAFHALPAHHQIPHGLAEHVAHRQRAGHVGGRNDDHERPARRDRRRGGSLARLEDPSLLPHRIPAGFDAAGIVGLLERLGIAGTHGRARLLGGKGLAGSR